jgi:hypothetical protein
MEQVQNLLCRRVRDKPHTFKSVDKLGLPPALAVFLAELDPQRPGVRRLDLDVWHGVLS